jgi:hypothetical protein
MFPKIGTMSEYDENFKITDNSQFKDIRYTIKKLIIQTLQSMPDIVYC